MDIKNSVVAILNSKGKIVGTGFLVSQNMVVTCAHVVVAAGATDGDTVQVRFHERKEILNTLVLPEYWRNVDKGDIAVLRLENMPPDVITPLPLGNVVGSPGHDFYAYGYATVTDVQGIGARGTIVDIVDNGRLVQLTSQEPDHGMSGGPVLDEQRRVVIGMVTKGKGLLENHNLRNTQTTFAISTDVILEVCQILNIMVRLSETEKLATNNSVTNLLKSVNPSKLRKAMHKAYDRYEFERFLKDNLLDYHDLPEGPLENKIMYSIDWFRRRKLYDVLVSKVLNDHPELRDDLDGN